MTAQIIQFMPYYDKRRQEREIADANKDAIKIIITLEETSFNYNLEKLLHELCFKPGK